MGNLTGLNKAQATHGKPKWADQGRGDTWETHMGSTRERHMGNPNGLTKAEATHEKPKAALSFKSNFQDAVCAAGLIKFVWPIPQSGFVDAPKFGGKIFRNPPYKAKALNL